MIRPRYIICSESRIVDRATGLVSHINVLDQLVVTAGGGRSGQQAILASSLDFVVVAVWMREGDEDPDETYDFETNLYFPGETEPRRVAEGHLQFGENVSYRIETHFQAFPSPPGKPLPEDILRFASGELRVESRIRRAGDEAEKWLSQEYSVPLRVASSSPATTA